MLRLIEIAAAEYQPAPIVAMVSMNWNFSIMRWN